MNCAFTIPAERSPRDPRAGSVLFMTLGVLFLLLALGSTAFLRATMSLREAGFYAQDAQALFHAEAGAEFCFHQITNDYLTGAIFLETPVEAVAYSPPVGYSFDPVTSLDRLADGKSYVYRVTGRAGEAEVVVETVFFRQPGQAHAVQTDGPIQLLNASQGVGDLRSNEDIEAGGPVTGNAMPGPGYSVILPANVSGSTAPAPSVFVLDPVDPDALADASSNNDNTNVAAYVTGTDFAVSGGNVTLPAGVYYFNDMQIDTGATIDIPAGEAIVYCTGQFSLTGASEFNSSGDPDRLKIFSTTTGTMLVDGGATLYAHVYAPSAAVFRVDNSSELHGSLVSGGTAVFDHDSRFSKAGTSKGAVVLRRSWRQVF